MGARAAARPPRRGAALAAVPARRAASLSGAGIHPVAGRLRRDDEPRLVAARLLGRRARRAGRRQGLPAARALAAALLPAGAAVSPRAACRRDPARDRAAPGSRSGSALCGRVLPAAHLHPHRAGSGGAGPARAGADHRLLLQRVPDAASRRGDPGQLRAHDRAPDRVPRSAHLHRLHDRGRGAPCGPRVEPARRLQRPQRLLRALPLLDRPAGGEMASFPRRARAARAAPRPLPRRGRSRRCAACPRWRGCAGAPAMRRASRAR